MIGYSENTWAEDTAPQGCDRSADPAAGMAGRRKSPSVTYWGDLDQGPCT